MADPRYRRLTLSCNTGILHRILLVNASFVEAPREGGIVYSQIEVQMRSHYCQTDSLAKTQHHPRIRIRAPMRAFLSLFSRIGSTKQVPFGL